ncbi:MAG: PAS domain S-box protein [Phycisphaerae bacterium]
MSSTRIFVLRSLLWIQIISAVAALVIASSVVSSNHRHRETVEEQVRARHRLKLVAAREHVEKYVAQIQLCLRSMSLYPHLFNINEDTTRYLQALYDANYDQHNLSEIYVLKPDFQGIRRPYRTFERGDEDHEVEELHSLEREEEEYAVQVRQIQRFSNDPSLNALISEPVELCVGEAGRVFSVPIRGGERLEGIVAGMIPCRVISDVLGDNNFGDIVLMANDSGSAITSKNFPDTMKSWFHERFSREGVRTFFQNRAGLFQANQYRVLSSQISIPGDLSWRIALLYDEEAALRESGISSDLEGWSAAVVVFLLGGAVVILCRVSQAVLKAREEADERAGELRDKEGRLRSILDTAAEGIIIINEKGIIESYNHAAMNMFGWTAEEAIGKNVALLAPPPFAKEHDSYIARYLETGERHIIGRGREEVGLHKDGTTFPMYLSVSEVRLGDRRVFTGIARDITEVKHAEETIRKHNEILEHRVEARTAELEAAKEKAEASNRAKSTFLANVSHELRTPLHGILSFAGFGINKYTSVEPKKLHDYFQMIHQSGHTLLSLLNDLLDLAKLESGTMTFDYRKSELGELIHSVTKEFAALASERKIMIRCVGPMSRVVLELDPERTKQVIRNLLSNAVKFSPIGGTIEVGMNAANGSAVVSVGDHGPGIPPDELDLVFDKFVQSSKTRTGAGGTGLGLAICRQMITAQKGRIWAENNTNGGALFRFELPITPTNGARVDSVPSDGKDRIESGILDRSGGD